MFKSDSIKELATALSKAQNQMSGAVKDSKNPFFKSSYADLGAVVSAIKESFAANELSYSQFPLMEDGKVGVETILMHSSGEWISSTLLLPITKQDPQAAGSAITYARRYALQAIAGIPAEDDDGNAAAQPNKQNVNIGAVAKLYWALDPDEQKRRWPTYKPEERKAIIAATPK
jgi:hypothetical protein